MKKKLLLTMGCSFTEGVGSYDMEYINTLKNKLPDYEDITRLYEVYPNSKKRFQQYSWPTQLQKKLNYDKLINIGSRGTANSHQLKKFVEKYTDVNFSSDYDVLVIWMMSFPSRISFYNKGMVQTILNNFVSGNESYDNLSRSLVEWIDDPHHDFMLEQLHEVRMMKMICNSLGYNFLFLSVNEYSSEFFDKIYPVINTSNLDKLYTSLVPEEKSIIPSINKKHLWSTICFHPNEMGYETIAENIYKTIQYFYPTYIGNKKLIEYESIYDDVDFDWKPQYEGK